MFIGKIGEQSPELKISAINRSAAQKNEAITGIKKEDQERDIAAISPVGKKQSRIEQLMKQKQNLMDIRDEKIASAAENGQDIKQDLDEYEKQLRELDEQIAQLQNEPQEGVKNTEDESGIYQNPKTKEEAERDQIMQLTELASGSGQAEILSSVKDKLDRTVAVLESEIKSGYGNIETKLHDISELESRSRTLTEELGEKLHEANTTVSDMREAAPVEDKVSAEDNISAEDMLNAKAYAADDIGAL